MIKIINSKRYNTETATEIASYDNGIGKSNFEWMEESLYKSKNGQWFIAGEGGALSKYAQSCGNNSYGGGENLELIDECEARQWLEDHNEISALEANFNITEG